MKFIVVVALCVAAASAYIIPPNVGPNDAEKIQQIRDALNHPNIEPEIAAALEQMLQQLLAGQPPASLDEDSPISVGPAIVEEDSPISVGPAIVEEDSPISVGPAIIEEDSPISVEPALVDESVVVEPASPQNTPIIQVIINVNTADNSVIVEKPEIQPTPVIVVEKPEIEPTPVIIVEKPEIEPTPVIIVDEAEALEPVIVAPVIIPEDINVQPEPIIVAPIEPNPVINLPESLN